MHNVLDRRRRSVSLSLMAGCLVLGLSSTQVWAAGRPAAEGMQGAAGFGARVAWETRLHSWYTLSILSCHLVEGHIYAIASDGSVFALRADTGELIWVRRVVDEGQTLRPPVFHRTLEREAIVFTTIGEVRFLEPRSGYEIHRVVLANPAVSQVALSEDRVFAAQTGQRLGVYRLADSVPLWRAEFSSRLLFPPIYVKEGNFVVVADMGGVVAGVRATDSLDDEEKTRQTFAQQFRGEPEGALAFDGSAVYFSTSNQMLHVLDLKGSETSRVGDILWEYRLERSPEGAPLVTATTIYQATKGGGLHRIGKEPLRPNWYDPAGRQFLAEWPEGVVLMREGGQLALVRDKPEDPVAVMDIGGFSPALSNTVNDAVYLINEKSVIRCIRPADAPPLTLASFKTAPPLATQPAAAEPPSADDQPADAAAEDSAPVSNAGLERPDPFRSPKPTTE